MDLGRFKITSCLPKGLKKRLKKYSLWFLPAVFILIGIFFLLFPRFYRGEFSRITFKEKSLTYQEPIQIDPQLLMTKTPVDPPVRIVIPSAKIDLPIVEAKVVKGYWETSATSASHGVGSASPGEKGNMVIFAHARSGLFLPLKGVENGDDIEILTQDKKFRYQVFEIKKVTPDQVEVISQTPEERLTLYTCSGFLDKERLVVVAKPSNETPTVSFFR